MHIADGLGKLHCHVNCNRFHLLSILELAKLLKACFLDFCDSMNYIENGFESPLSRYKPEEEIEF